jgi:two-component system response regulator GlrR
VTVLLEGETGTGKDLAAESIHRGGPRREGPFVVVDCASVPPGLLENELFGHERGAFTGASEARGGAFEAADGGTIFLDEVGELDAQLQPKLLRALEKREVKRIGASAWTPIDVRVISATHRNLRADVNVGRFRPDLYYRLAVMRIVLPPLRERLGDLELLIDDLLDQLGAGGQRRAPLRAEALRAGLARHAWPGNVRELRSAVERAVLMADPAYWADLDGGTEASGSSGAFVFDPDLSYRMAKERLLAEWERWFTAELLRRHDGNLTRAARAARMDRAHLRELVRRHKTPARDDS